MIITPDNDVNGPPIPGIGPVVFLGGGITGCPDWQSDILSMIECENYFMVANPRRENWDMSSDSGEQIRWEYRWLDRADIVSFWFPCETLCPITLYELADVTRRVMYDQDSQGDRLELVVGAHREYERRFDIEYQTALRLGEDFHICASIELLAHRINRRLAWWWEEHGS